jgi:hypothetical protein
MTTGKTLRLLALSLTENMFSYSKYISKIALRHNFDGVFFKRNNTLAVAEAAPAARFTFRQGVATHVTN